MDVDLRWAYFFISIFVSLAVYSATPLTNTDGVLYLRVAQEYLHGGYEGALELYRLPFYSISVAFISSILPTDLLWSAYLFNSLACGIIAWCIADLGRLVGGDRGTTFLSGLLFILHPEFNEYRSFIIRDFHFWALSLASVCCWIRFYLTQNVRLLFIGSVLILGAAFFRFEAIFLMAAPFVCSFWLKKYSVAFDLMLKFYGAFFLVALCIVFLFYLIFEEIFFSASKYVFLQLIVFFENISKTIDVYKEAVLVGYLEDYAGQAVIGSFIVMLFLKFLSEMTPIYIVLFAYAYKAVGDFSLSEVRRVPLLAFLYVFLVVVFLHLISEKVIQGRHVIFPVLLLIPILASYLNFIIFIKGRKRFGIGIKYFLVGFLFIYLFVDSFFSFGQKKTYLVDSSAWLSENYLESCRLVTNNSKVGYFSGMEVVWSEYKNFRAKRKFNFLRYDIYAYEYKSMEERGRIFSLFSEKVIKEFQEKDRGILILHNKDGKSRCLRGVESE